MVIFSSGPPPGSGAHKHTHTDTHQHCCWGYCHAASYSAVIGKATSRQNLTLSELSLNGSFCAQNERQTMHKGPLNLQTSHYSCLSSHSGFSPPTSLQKWPPGLKTKPEQKGSVSVISTVHAGKRSLLKQTEPTGTPAALRRCLSLSVTNKQQHLKLFFLHSCVYIED